MKTEEKIIRKMQILSNEYDTEEKRWRKDHNPSDSFKKCRLRIINELRVLSWITGIKFDKFIKTKST